MYCSSLKLAATLLVFAFSTYGLADEHPGAQEVVQDRQDRLLDEQFRRLEELKALSGKLQTSEPQPALADSRCFTINTLELKGANSLSSVERERLTYPFRGRCLGVSQLNELLKAVTGRYIDKGSITSRAYLPQQDLSTGHLQVLVVEGHLSKLKSDAKSRLTDRELAMAFPGREGQLVNLRQIEQMVDQLNRLPSNRAQVEITPGHENGASEIVVKNTPAPPWRVSLARHNYGQEGTGEQQWKTALEWDSPLGLADQLTLHGGRDAISDKRQTSHSAALT